MNIQARIIGYVLLCAGLIACYIWWSHQLIDRGRNEVRAEWNSDKLKYEQEKNSAILKAVEENNIEKDRQIKINEDIANEYSKSINAANKTISDERANFANERLRFKRDNQSAAKADSSCSRQFDDKRTEEIIELPTAITIDLRQFAESADREIALKDAKIEALQEWIVKQGFYGKPNEQRGQ